MLDVRPRSTGTKYTATVAFLAAALIFSPAMLAVTRPFGYASVAMAFAGSLLCLTSARVTWKRFSRLTIPSIVKLEAAAK